MKAPTLARVAAALALALGLTPLSAQALDAHHRKQLERAGCTQASELQGCDLRKSKADNAKAGFGAPAPTTATGANPYAGPWVARNGLGATVATIRVDARERVWVNGKPVKAKRADGGLMFQAGATTFMIQGDRRLQGEDHWRDARAGTQGPIVSALAAHPPTPRPSTTEEAKP